MLCKGENTCKVFHLSGGNGSGTSNRKSQNDAHMRFFVVVSSKTPKQKEIKRLIKDGSRIISICGKTHCLRVNPKENLKD